MMLLKFSLLGLAAILIAAITLGMWVHSSDRAQAERVWSLLEAKREAAPLRYDPAMVADLPDIAQRYFARAIRPGTPLQRVVRLEMEGSFIMNDNAMPMTARQILAPPARGFVWQADIGAGLMRFGGSDGYHRLAGREESWTKFWLRGLVPLARIGGTQDHARAAATRVMMESIWAPATLLPQSGVEWTQTGETTAEIRFAELPGLEPMQITFDGEGNPLEIVALRWTDANSEKIFRLQPFGGRFLEMGRHEGFLVPTRVEMGNMFGTPDYVPFFLATITRAEF